MAFDPVKNILLDPHDGRSDIKGKLIRSIGDPSRRFSEDGLRVLRGCRFASQLGFKIEKKTVEGMKEQGFRLEFISAERIRDEIIKILLSDSPSKAFFIMKGAGILKYVIPELEEGIGLEQREMHSFDVFEHSLYSADFAEKNIIIKLAALFHDIGKPASLDIKEGIRTFYNHDRISADMASVILKRLKFPKAVEKQVTHLIAEHMFNYTEEWTDSALRRLISRVGRENISDLIKLRYADRAGMKGKPFECTHDKSFISRINSILENENVFSIKNLAVDGNILSEKGGIPKGPEMGSVLNFLLETVLEDPEMNTPDKLIEIAGNFYNERIDIE
jgi:putative nucleotidyltransferase with HDIG domain